MRPNLMVMSIRRLWPLPATRPAAVPPPAGAPRPVLRFRGCADDVFDFGAVVRRAR